VDALSCQRQSFRQVWDKAAIDCMRNAKNRVPKAAMLKIRNPHTDPNYHQKLITSRGPLLADACHVWSTSVSAFVSYLCLQNDRMNGRQNDHITSADHHTTSAWSAEVISQ